MPGSTLVNPVTLPPGRARLATSPSAIGSGWSVKTIGIVGVALIDAAIEIVLLATMTSGASAMISVTWA
jgi:hypothetical protein